MICIIIYIDNAIHAVVDSSGISKICENKTVDIDLLIRCEMRDNKNNPAAAHHCLGLAMTVANLICINE